MAFSKHVDLTASIVETITVDRISGFVQVMNVTGTEPLYYTLDGSTPTVEGDDTKVIPGIVGASFKANVIHASDVHTVKVISIGTDNVNVEAM